MREEAGVSCLSKLNLSMKYWEWEKSMKPQECGLYSKLG